MARIPFLADLRKVDDKAQLRALSANKDLDRRFEDIGPAVNRTLLGNIRRVMQVDGKPLPSVAPRGDVARAASQQALRKRLDPSTGPLWDEETLARLVAGVRGAAGADTLGPATLQAVGRLFSPSYVGDERSYAAAKDFDDAIRSRNPIRLVQLHATGRLRRSSRLLAEMVNGDRAGVHATGIAVHNMVRGFEKMREVYGESPRPAAEDAVKRCLFAPATVLRQATAKGQTAAGEVERGTLMLFELDKMREKSGPDAEAVFMAGTWAECPALFFVPALYRAVWDRAIAAEQQP